MYSNILFPKKVRRRFGKLKCISKWRHINVYNPNFADEASCFLTLNSLITDKSISKCNNLFTNQGLYILNIITFKNGVEWNEGGDELDS